MGFATDGIMCCIQPAEGVMMIEIRKIHLHQYRVKGLSEQVHLPETFGKTTVT